MLASLDERQLDTIIALLEASHDGTVVRFAEQARVQGAKRSTLAASTRKQSARSVALKGLPHIISRTESSTRVFFGHLGSFFTHRRNIDAVYAANSAEGELEAIEVEATGIQNDDKTFKPERRQLSLSGEPVQSLDELYAAADEAFEPLRQLLATVCEGVEGVHFDVAPPKGRERAGKKARDSYGDRNPGPAEAWLYDIARSSVYCERGTGLAAVLVALTQQPGVEVVKSKNRFKKPTPAGFRDVMVLVRLCVGSSGCFHICEIQLHLEAVKVFDKEHDSHSHYEFFRDYFEGAMEAVDQRLTDLRAIIGESEAAGGGDMAMGRVDDDDNDEALLRLVEDVVCANDATRIQAMADLMVDFLCESELAGFLYRHLVQLLSGDALAAPYRKLAQACSAQGKYNEALQHYHKALAIGLQAHAQVEEDIVDTYRGIGWALFMQGKYAESRENYDKALAIVGLEHKLSSDILCGIAALLSKAAHFDEARQYYDKALAAKASLDGLDHRSVAGIYGSIGFSLWEQNKHDEALQFYHKALAIEIRSLGPDHSAVGTIYNNIAAALGMQHKRDEARPYLEKALAIAIKSRGPNHIEVAAAYNNLAGCLQLDDKELTMQYNEKALAIVVKAVGPEHEHAGRLHMNIGVHSRGEKQLEHFRQALAVWLKALGPEHPSTGDAYEALARSIRWLEYPPPAHHAAEAMRLYTAAAAAYRAAYGAAHPETQAAVRNAEEMRCTLTKLEQK
jgi:tetratricopeptide (TPR) repeat protein